MIKWLKQDARLELKDRKFQKKCLEKAVDIEDRICDVLNFLDGGDEKLTWMLNEGCVLFYHICN